MAVEITRKQLIDFKNHMIQQEKSKATIEKYMRDVHRFYRCLKNNKVVDKDTLVWYKENLYSQYKVTSANSMLAAINYFLDFIGLTNLKVKVQRIQKRVFSNQDKELTKKEYEQLLQTARNQENERLYLLIQAICGTGIRVSEHKYITVEALHRGRAVVHNKGKVREIYFSKKLCRLLLAYCKKNKITNGCVFITKHGKPLDRSNIWKMMKNLCGSAGVDQEKVFPHNLRHLFAFTYYRIEKDLVKLAGILGHANIETTRIYTLSSGDSCMKTLSKMNLIPQF